jgi:3-dehydroquinate synthase
VDSAFVERLTRLIAAAGLPITGPDLGADRYIELMRLDKKSVAGDIRFVVIESPGRAATQPAPEPLVREVLAACTR